MEEVILTSLATRHSESVTRDGVVPGAGSFPLWQDQSNKVTDRERKAIDCFMTLTNMGNSLPV